MAGQQTVHDGNEDVSWEDQVRNDDLKKQAQRELLQTSDEDLDVLNFLAWPANSSRSR